MSRRKAKIILSLLAVIVVAALIFFFSAQEGPASAKLSGSVTEWLLSLFIPGFSDFTRAEKRPYLLQWSLIVRKAAHFSEYALLATTLVVFLHYKVEKRRRVAFGAWALATLYACTDEWHQSFVTSRGPAATDVCIDSAGALTGVILGMLLLAVWYKIKRKRDCLAQ